MRVRTTAVGVNFIDVLQRRFGSPPAEGAAIGMESVGVVVSVGADVEDLPPGTRVGVATGGPGAYATIRDVTAEAVVPLPADVSDEDAATLLFKGLTAQYLIERTGKAGAGDTIVVHAAAGGVGAILCGWANQLGATVIGVAGGPERCAAARTFGAHHVIDHRSEGVAERVAAITSGRKADVVYDSVGLATWEGSMDSLRRFGLLMIYGGASGPTPPIDPELLNRKGGLFLTRPSVFTLNAGRDDLLANAESPFSAVRAGRVTPHVGARFALAEAAAAHQALEARQTIGSILLTP